jgi:hypothetical protein
MEILVDSNDLFLIIMGSVQRSMDALLSGDTMSKEELLALKKVLDVLPEEAYTSPSAAQKMTIAQRFVHVMLQTPVVLTSKDADNG